MHFIFWIIFGAIIGWIAAILQGEDTVTKRGLAFILAGTIGGLTGGLSGLALTPDIDSYDAQAGGLSFSVFGAIAFVMLAQLAARHASKKPHNP